MRQSNIERKLSSAETKKSTHPTVQDEFLRQQVLHMKNWLDIDIYSIYISRYA